MPEPVKVRRYEAFASLDGKEILRYAGAASSTPQLERLLASCVEEAGECLRGRLCFLRLPVRHTPAGLDLGFAETDSRALTANLDGCGEILLFAATLGLGIDRLIRKYSLISPARAALLQAIGAERIEALCDRFCRDMQEQLLQEGLFLRPRFSPGYGDLPLGMQRRILGVLGCERNIGVYLNESLLMSPSKSVTAIVGLGKKTCAKIAAGCPDCEKTDCPFRKEEKE